MLRPEPVDQGPTVMKRTLMIAALLGALLGSAPGSAAPPGALGGAGAGTPQSGTLCDGTVAVAVAGVNLVDNLWTFSGTAVINPAGPCLISIAFVGGATGTWNPASGGCVGDELGGSVCVGPVPSKLMPTQTNVDVCPGYLGGCVSGSAIVERI